METGPHRRVFRLLDLSRWEVQQPMTATVTIDNVTTELYSSAEVIDLMAPFGGVGHIDGFKYKHRLKTYRLFNISTNGVGRVMYAPEGFTWVPGLLTASATTMKTRHNYFDKAEVDALVASLA
jgi:hypothetical protein